MRHAVLVVSVLIFGVLVLVLSALAEKRVALVIGNSAYQHVPAPLNPANDARDIAAALRALGFGVLLTFASYPAETSLHPRRENACYWGQRTGRTRTV
jgi:hypothetical protein